MAVHEGLDFFLRFLRNPTHIGAIWPSSRRLARRMGMSFDWSRVRTIVEYGPGTGVFTREVALRLRPGAQLLAIERDPQMAARLRQKFEPLGNSARVEICVGDVREVVTLCQSHHLERVDAIMSGLPWALFPETMQDAILDETARALAPGGQFSTFAYLQGLLLPAGWRFRRKLKERFSRVRVSGIEWFNLPPAFIYTCTRD